MFFQHQVETSSLAVHDGSNGIEGNHNISQLLRILDMYNHSFPCSFQHYRFCLSWFIHKLVSKLEVNICLVMT